MARTSFLAVIAGLALATTAATAPAAAHDALLSSEPADGASLDEPPRSVVLEFSGEILELNPALELTSPEGAVELGEAQIEGPLVTWDLLAPEALPAGDYGVVWAVTSQDGHPIEGSFDFAVDAAWTPAVEASATPEPAEVEASSQAPDPAESAETDGPGAPGSGETLVPVGEGSLDGPPGGSDLTDVSGTAETWFFAGLAVTALVAIAVVLAMRRNRDPNGPPGQH